MKEIVLRVALSQPLVSIPPYRGNLLDYIQQKEDEDPKLKEKVASIIEMYIALS